MEEREFEKVLKVGEGVSVEFKRCGNKPEQDTFETICSFANHSGGQIFLGVEDDGAVTGVNEKECLNIQRNIINVVNNPNIFQPSVPIEFEPFKYQDKQIIRVWVPLDAFVHEYKHEIYDRMADADVVLRLDSQKSDLYLRKQSSYTEQKIFPYVKLDDLELDLLDDARQQALIKRPGHPWGNMSNEEILRSAGLYARNYATGEEGYNLAAVLLLGKEEVISSIVPAYKTDAILRINNLDRYDDRITVKCNLIRAYPILQDFCKKHMDDRFYLENGQAVSPRDIITRAVISNTLIHREYLSAFPAKVIISRNEIVTENGSKAIYEGPLDLASFSPMPKNPLIANFFNSIGRADELGSGSKNLLKYVRIYSGEEPSLIEGNVFRARVPLVRNSKSFEIDPLVSDFVSNAINKKGYVTTVEVRDALGIDHKAAQRELLKLVSNGVLLAKGNTRARKYIAVSKDQ